MNEQSLLYDRYGFFGTSREFCSTILFIYLIIIIVLNSVAVESQHCLMAANDEFEWILNDLMVKLHFHWK